jgi:ABC-2 type transport system ATP-binding protein
VTKPAVVVDGVCKNFRLYRERNGSLKVAIMRRGRAKYDEFEALKDVSFEIPSGSTFGLMGVNGSGKSTLLKCIANILVPESGTIMTRGKVAALLELGSGFHPELSGRENVYLNGSILGLSKQQLDARFDEIVDFAGVEQFIDQPVKNFSSGMYVRLGFSVAINVEPDVLLVDEVLAVGDVSFQEKCMAKFADLKRRGKTVVVVSHAMGSMRDMCDEVAWLEGGRLLDTGVPGPIIDRYMDAEHGATSTPDGGGPRFGSGEAQIAKVTVLGRTGQPTTLVHTGDPITVRLDVECRQRVADPVFGLTLMSREGLEVWSQNTRDAEFATDAITGNGCVELSVPSLPLLPGAYDLNASIRDSSLTHVYDFHRDCYPFFVESGPVRERGFTSLSGRWSQTQAHALSALELAAPAGQRDSA